MKPLIRFSALMSCALVLAACGGDGGEEDATGMKVAGEISFSSGGNIYVQLITKQQYEAGVEGDVAFAYIIDTKGQSSGKVPFSFDNVPAGTYTVDVYQDTNNNGKFDTAATGAPEEPWANYVSARPPMERPTFEEVSFSLDNDLTDIQIALQK